MNAIEFLASLAHDPVRQLAFQRDPEAVAREAGLDERLLPVLRDPAALRGLLAAGGDGAMVYSPESAMVYSPESAMVYSPESAMVYSPEAALIYSPESAMVYSAQSA